MTKRARTFHKHETQQERYARLAKEVSATRRKDGSLKPLPKDFIPDWHDRNWTAGPPPLQLALYLEMETAHSAYAGVR